VATKSEAVRAIDAPDATDATDAAGGGPDAEASDGRAVRAERRRAERREAILVAAKRVFRDKGYHQASVHDIIDDAQIARGTFYLYFSSKQEVFAQLADDFLRVTRGQVKRISLAPGADPPLLQLRANFRRVLSTVREHDDVASIILRDPISFDEESRARVNLFFDQVLTMIEDALRVGQGLGLVGACNIHIVAVTALGGLRAALNRMLAANEGDARERAFSDPERVADELMTFFLRGMSDGHVQLP
jgi:AcrR family transcriptional regulator